MFVGMDCWASGPRGKGAISRLKVRMVTSPLKAEVAGVANDGKRGDYNFMMPALDQALNFKGMVK